MLMGIDGLLFSYIQDMDEKRMILDFMRFSDFKDAPNPPKYIMKANIRKTKSEIEFDEFLRIIKHLEMEKYLSKSTGPNGEDCYELTYNSVFIDEIEEEERLKFRKLQLDVKNAERINKTYPTTRLITWITFIVMLILAALKITEVMHIWSYHK